MRSSDIIRDPFIRVEEKDRPCGLSLPATGWHEHEVGISYLNSLLGIDQGNPNNRRGILPFAKFVGDSVPKFGIAKRLMTKVPPLSAWYFTRGSVSGFYVGGQTVTLPYLNSIVASSDEMLKVKDQIIAKAPVIKGDFWSPDIMRYATYEVRMLAQKAVSHQKTSIGQWLNEHPHEQICGAWDDREFVIYAAGPEAQAALADIVQAYEKRDLMVCFGERKVFGSGGLSLVVASQVPDNFAKHLYDEDVDDKNLADAAAATGIVELLKSAGKTYHALVPQWADASKSSVNFFLNPQDQKRYQPGWMTVTDLHDWIAGKGKAVKSANAAMTMHS
jgi:hypothetical protein